MTETATVTEPSPRPGLPPKQSSSKGPSSTTALSRARPSRLSMEGYIFNADKALEVALNPTTRELPTELFHKCKGIAILNIVHVGVVLTMYVGTGVLMAKKTKGTEAAVTTDDKEDDGNSDTKYEWSPPSAVLANGYSMGALVGGKSDSIILFIMDDETMEDFASRPQTRMGVDAALAIGHKGGAKNLGIDKGTVSFTFTSGAFAGVGLQMGTLVNQEDQNKVFYSKKVSPKSILLENAVRAPANSQVPDVYKKLDMLARGDTWVPSPEDLQRSSRFLEGAQSASQRFIQADLS